MIHSLAGGEIREKKSYTFCKVEIVGEQNLKLWYLSDIFGLEIGDRVMVPLGKTDAKKVGEIVEIKRGITADRSPIPTKMAKYIFCKI